MASWNYGHFTAVAVALLALIAVWPPFLARRSVSSAWLTAGGLWLLAAFAISGPLYLGRGDLRGPFIWQRDAGFLLGSSAALAVPFVIVLLLLFFLRRRSARTFHVLAVASAVAGLLLLVLPPLYLAGWFAGCILAGYRPCI